MVQLAREIGMMRRLVFDSDDGEFYIFPEGVSVGNYLEVQLIGEHDVLSQWQEGDTLYEVLSYRVMVTCSSELEPFEADLRFVWPRGKEGLPEQLEAGSTSLKGV